MKQASSIWADYMAGRCKHDSIERKINGCACLDGERYGQALFYIRPYCPTGIQYLVPIPCFLSPFNSWYGSQLAHARVQPQVPLAIHYSAPSSFDCEGCLFDSGKR
jgi:hypothetical protein